MDNSKLSNEHYAALGRISISIAHLETTLRYAIANIINPNHVAFGLILTRTLNAVPMTELLLPLIKYSIGDTKVFSSAKGLMIKIKEFIKERNILIHSIWREDPHDNILKREKILLTDHELDFDIEPLDKITVERLNKLVVNIDHATDLLIIMLVSIVNSERKV